MTLLETFLIPFGTSILANFGTDKIKEIFTKDSIDKYEKSFVNAMISTIEKSTANYFFEDKTMRNLVKKIKDDEQVLLVTIESYCTKTNKNFLNLIETDKYKGFFVELLKSYSIYPENKDMQEELYTINLSEFLVNYKYEFFKLTFSNHEMFAVFNEVLKIDNVMDLLKDMNLKIDEFDNIKNLFLEQYVKVNQVYKKNRDDYDKYISRKFEFLELAGFSPKISGKDIFMKLSDVFIPLSINGSDNNGRNTTLSKQQSIQNILKEKAIVILGDPGSGKSTLLKYIASYISANREKDWHYKETIPILIKVSEYADWYQTYKKGLFDYIIEHDSQYANLIKENIEYSNLLILLD